MSGGVNKKVDPGSGSGMTKRKQPRWAIPFLRALARTGDVRASAEDAGIDHTTAYARRKAHPGFAADWAAALEGHAARVEVEREEELASTAPPPHSVRSPSPSELGEDWVAAGSQVKRAGHGRWGPRKEKAFFDELAATANVKRAAKAAGVSANAVYARRLRDPHFKAKWAAVLETGRAAIEMHLVEAANRSFDPDDLDVGEATPKVSVAEAIRITQGSGSRKQEAAADAFEDESYDPREEVNDIREQLVQKLQRMRRRDRVELQQRGWSYDESWDVDIPPGWAKTPAWRPMEPGDSLY